MDSAVNQDPSNNSVGEQNANKSPQLKQRKVVRAGMTVEEIEKSNRLRTGCPVALVDCGQDTSCPADSIA